MNGKKESLTAKENMEKWDKALDEYENSIGLPPSVSNYSNSEARSFMSMGRKQIEKLSPEDCAQAALILNEMSLHVQRAFNREMARVNWAEDTIKDVVADDVGNHSGYSYQERYYKAVKNNEYAKKLSKIKKYAQQRADRLTYVANSFNTRADIFLSIQRAKRYNNAG